MAFLLSAQPFRHETTGQVASEYFAQWTLHGCRIGWHFAGLETLFSKARRQAPDIFAAPAPFLHPPAPRKRATVNNLLARFRTLREEDNSLLYKYCLLEQSTGAKPTSPRPLHAAARLPLYPAPSPIQPISIPISVHIGLRVQQQHGYPAPPGETYHRVASHDCAAQSYAGFAVGRVKRMIALLRAM